VEPPTAETTVAADEEAISGVGDDSVADETPAESPIPSGQGSPTAESSANETTLQAESPLRPEELAEAEAFFD
jgi:hypothetical protein